MGVAGSGLWIIQKRPTAGNFCNFKDLFQQTKQLWVLFLLMYIAEINKSFFSCIELRDIGRLCQS